MNASLMNPFNITYPTAVQASLPSQASIARYDPSGRFVAAGRNDGSAAIWDLETRAAVRWLEGHVKGITSVDWSRHSRFVLTSSKDWNVIVWDLASDIDPPQRRTTIRFDAPVSSASFHPRNSRIILALLTTGDAYLVDLRKNHRGRVELVEVQNDNENEAQTSSPRSAMTVARFDPSGKHVFIGTSVGSILVFNTRTKIMVARHKISGAGVMRGLEFARSGRRLVTNSADRTLRQFNLPSYPSPSSDKEYLEQDLEPTHRFNDPINRNAWHGMAYSPDGEWLAGGAADPATHKIYIWDISNDGQFASALDGGREPLLFVDWHPHKPAIASTTNQGNILIWHCPVPERWGAFAGGFEEVDENVEYEEREDEFDIEDESELALRKMKEEEEEVDIISGIDDGKNGVGDAMRVDGQDEDATWADEEGDGDVEGWRMKIVVEEDGM
ncbi:WD40 repeat-like protein [Dentipellis sp. KUC8613]|nr:WD40 repeat-like protein [Dentipellis sp. KUC8613]